MIEHFKIKIHQTHQTIADFSAIFLALKSCMEKKDADIHVFPELFLSGYPLQDLCIQQCFIKSYLDFIRSINEWSTSFELDESQMILMGGLHYLERPKDGIPKIENVIYKLVLGRELEPIYSKQLLPSYDIFDETKYFKAGKSESTIVEFKGQKLGLLICEDMWRSSRYTIDPIEQLFITGQPLDAVINFSASPYGLQKRAKRFNRVKYVSQKLNAPVIYVNRVGGEDEVLFDGSSFVANVKTIMTQLDSFAADEQIFDLLAYHRLDDLAQSTLSLDDKKPDGTFHDLIYPELDFVTGELPTIYPLFDKNCQDLIKAIGFGLQEYTKKSGFSKFVVALSGGIDSALVVALIKLSLKSGQSLECIYMPSKFSADMSYHLSKQMCDKLGIKLHVLDINGLYNSCNQLFTETIGDELLGLSDENLQSRLRGLLLMARSNQDNSLVINTSNKSELSVGYSTIYGDSVGAISLLGDLYKSEVFALANYINQHYDEMIPTGIITRPPSAELRADQKDSDSLPPYERLDAILECLLSYQYTVKQIIKLGFEEKEVQRVTKLLVNAEYKRTQFCPIIKLKSKSFGFGYRVPISKSTNFYYSS